MCRVAGASRSRRRGCVEASHRAMCGRLSAYASGGGGPSDGGGPSGLPMRMA